ncbi:Rv3654c family TadE-like protein [Knoellia sp. CPCC 206453]|uniref:Rv3654c family TadE-like protein n=1 Tax=Knoellia pratensis TaxID=3404796 RepID=UPI003613B37C
MLEPARAGNKSSVPGRWGERGSGTVLAVAAIGVLLVLTTAGLQLGAAATAAHRARTAADLAALAGATALQEGQANACARAAAVAGRNDAQVVVCALGENDSVSIRVSMAVATRWPGVPDRAVASARAGPADVPRP